MAQSIPVRLWHVALSIFFDRLEVVGGERIPSRGPAILTSNHPSSLIDPLVILATIRRHVHFLAQAGLFRGPLRSGLMRLAGALPVYREADDPSKLRRNVATFEECRKLLESGKLIGIFPEGTTHSEPQVRTLKRGVARIALDVESRQDFQTALRIFPVGLNYSELGRFRSRCLVVVGEPIGISSYEERYRANRRNAEKELTEEIKANLERHTLHMKKLRFAELVKEVEDIYRDELTDRMPPRIAAFEEPERSLEVSKAIIRAVEYFDDIEPDRVRRIWHSIGRYQRCLRWVGLSDETFHTAPKQPRRRGGGLKIVPGFIFGFPVAVYGMVNNIVPYLIPLIPIGAGSEESQPSCVHQVLLRLFQLLDVLHPARGYLRDDIRPVGVPYLSFHTPPERLLRNALLQTASECNCRPPSRVRTSSEKGRGFSAVRYQGAHHRRPRCREGRLHEVSRAVGRVLGIAVDLKGNVYVADGSNANIQKFTSSGKFLKKWALGGSRRSEFGKARGIAVDSSGNVLVTDCLNNRIQVFDSSGKFITKWSGSGFGGPSLKWPCGIAVDSSGNIYVADRGNNRILKLRLRR
ncbi:MAG: 1-acyl-sn-glycerol-3-phosphate acyltransferase [bacterium]|nr:1-acyl-sn-glycerol-3-phosphate acyltransferase [bacterium]